MKNQKNRFLKKAAFPVFVSVIVVCSLAALEIGARVRYQASYLTAHVADNRQFHHLPLPFYKGRMSSEGDFDDTYSTNNQGMRGPADYAYDKPEGVLRIGVLGDSFTFGVGVKPEETFAVLLQNFLTTLFPKKYEVLNFGVCSYSPLLELIYAKNELVKYRPDVLLLMLDLCDIQDDYFYEKHLVYDAEGEPIACDPYRVNGRPDLWALAKKHSYFLAVVDDKFFQSIRKMKTIGFGTYLRNKMKGIRNKTEIMVNRDIDSIQFDRFIFSREDKDPAIVERHWSRTAGALAKIKAWCDRNGVKLILVAYPYGHEVGVNQWAKGRRYWGFEANKVYDATRPFSMIRDFAAKEKIDFISLYVPMREHAASVLYYHNDGHWTKEGHRVAASAIFDSPVFQKWLDSSAA